MREERAHHIDAWRGGVDPTAEVREPGAPGAVEGADADDVRKRGWVGEAARTAVAGGRDNNRAGGTYSVIARVSGGGRSSSV